MASPDQQTAATSTARGDSAASLEWAFPNRATPVGSSAYYAIRMSQAAHRNTLAALFALRAELQAIPDRVSEPGIARLKLDWWHGEIDRLFAGEPRHPLSEILAPVVIEHRLPQPAFVDLIEAVERLLRAHRHPDQAAQRQSDEQDLGALFELIARCEGADADDPSALTSARRTGGWCAQVRRIRDAGQLLRRGREVIPADQLAAAGLSQAQLASADGRQRLPELLQPLAEQLRATGPDQAAKHAPKPGPRQKSKHERKHKHKHEQPRQAAASPRQPPRSKAFATARPQPAGAGLTSALRVQLRLHQDLLEVLERSGFDVADQRIGLTPLRKFWLAWRATALDPATRSLIDQLGRPQRGEMR